MPKNRTAPADVFSFRCLQSLVLKMWYSMSARTRPTARLRAAMTTR